MKSLKSILESSNTPADPLSDSAVDNAVTAEMTCVRPTTSGLCEAMTQCHDAYRTLAESPKISVEIEKHAKRAIDSVNDFFTTLKDHGEEITEWATLDAPISPRGITLLEAVFVSDFSLRAKSVLRDAGFQAARPKVYSGAKLSSPIKFLYGHKINNEWFDVWVGVTADGQFFIADRKEVEPFKTEKETIKAFYDLISRAESFAENIDPSIVLENLTKDDSIEVWIHDFLYSEDPMLQGKSKKELIRLAIGAYYGATVGKERP